MCEGKVQSYLQDRDLKVTRGLKASRISQGSYSFFAKCVIIIPWITTRASSVILTFWSKKLITIGFFFRVVLYIFRAHWYSSDFYRINSSLSNTEITTRFSFINSNALYVLKFRQQTPSHWLSEPLPKMSTSEQNEGWQKWFTWKKWEKASILLKMHVYNLLVWKNLI